MPIFKSKPTQIEAVQLCWRNWNEVCSLLSRHGGNVKGEHMPPGASPPDTCGEEAPFIQLPVTTVHGDIAIVRHGDYIVPDGKHGTFYPIAPDIFARKYELYKPDYAAENAAEPL